MNLLDRIRASIPTSATKAQRAIAKSLPSTTSLDSSIEEDLFVLTDSPERLEIPLGQQRFPLPDRTLFLAIYESVLRRPHFFNVKNFYEYKKWLLDGSCYVLNTFKAVDANKLLELYLRHKPPDSIDALGSLSQLLWHIELFVPEEYQRNFEQIIMDEGKKL